ncbi:MAG: hypothetical protein ACO1N8_06280 [Methylophilus sp.]
MGRHDRTWAQMSKGKRISPGAIGVIDQPNPLVKFLKTVKRVFRAADFYATTRYSWSLAWLMAGKS